VLVDELQNHGSDKGFGHAADSEVIINADRPMSRGVRFAYGGGPRASAGKIDAYDYPGRLLLSHALG
jgi:hypothetical protein